jgi:dihydroorotate dehydrogenase
VVAGIGQNVHSMIDALYRKVLLPPVRRITADDAETAHEWFLRVMLQVERSSSARSLLARGFRPDPLLAQDLLDGVHFPTPFGIAAGFDKNARIPRGLLALTSAGFLEVGTVTARPQLGNPRPRIVRPDANSLINAMGFPNDGMGAVLPRLAKLPELGVPLGLNVGKMKDTPESGAAADYASLIAATAELRRSARRLPDYYVVNVSSPNTPGLTSFQRIEPLTEIVTEVCEQLDAIGDPSVNLRHRLLIKLGADLDVSELEAIVEMALALDIGGLITTNTTTTRPVSSRFDDRPGGFSGSALYERSAALTRHAASLLPLDKVLVATGGIDTVERAYEMLRHADLVAGYTGIVLQTPRLFRRLSVGVAERMRRDGVSSLRELRAAQRAN